MNSFFTRLGLSLLATLLAPHALAATLQSLDVVSLPGDRVELKLGFDQPASAPRGYTIDQPARIALDLPGVTSSLGVKSRDLGIGNARSLNIMEVKDRTRLVINLDRLTPYTSRVEGNQLYVVLGEQAVAAAPGTPLIASVPTPQAALAGGRVIRNVDFQRGEQGEGNVIIDLGDSGMAPEIQEQGGRIRLEFARAQLPEAQRLRLDVKDFSTPVHYVSSSVQGDKAVINIEPVGQYDFMAFQTDRRLTVSVKPLTDRELDRRKSERFAYTGEKLSLNFQDIEVRSVLQLIADFTNLNLVASDTVQGSITLRLQNVPWDQALDLVLKTKGLDKRQIGNVLLVAPAAEIAERERQELEAQRQVAELAPLRKDVIQLNYAKASDIAKLYESEAAQGTLKDDMRGSVIFDDRTNSLLVTLTQERIDELRRIVTLLDVPVRQVMIEARIVEANVDFDKSLGVRWGGSQRFANDRGVFYGNDDRGDEGGKSGAESTGNFPFVDLGVIGRTSGFGIGYVTDNLILDLELTAMEKTGNGEVVSQPKVVTADKETAKILKGAEIPYQEASSSGATATSFKEAALSLEVTPQITPDNRIIMDVKVTKDAPDFANALNGVPPINKNEVNAKVLVADGETIVIGGVFSNTQIKGVEKVPFLGDVPFIGRLFRRDIVQDKKSELLVFLTPRIMHGQALAVSR